MEENTAAVECLILFYINTKHVLKTKQLDERVFLDQMIRHVKECGFDGYSNDEIRNTWKNLTTKYVELKKTGTAEEKEMWKFYDILDSCYEQTDFHNGVYPKFSEEMVWFLIESFLKRKGLEKTQKKNSMLNEIHKDFLNSGYLYITRQDIENKWKYLNLKYDKLKDDPEAFDKIPFLQALRGFREKDRKYLVKMVFTKELTEILIERFTDKKITCVIHGYDSEQVLHEIQLEFRELGFDFSQEEIKEKWRKLINIYSFLKAKGKHDSPWVYFNAMKEHFKDDFLFGLGKYERDLREERQKSSRQRSKSVGPDARRKDNSEMKSKLIVNIEQLDEDKMSPKKSNDEKKRVVKRKASPKKIQNDLSESHELAKKSRMRSKSKERVRTNKNKGEEDNTESNTVASQQRESISLRRNHHLKSLSIDRNGNQERRSSADIGSPGSKVHIINIDESKIDKKSGNLTINLPSITKQFSDNEFLPLKKRLRMGQGNGDKHPDDSKDIKDGFRGFPSSDDGDARKRLKPDDKERLTDSEMEEIMKRIHEDKPEEGEVNSNNLSGSKNCRKPDEFNNYQGTYNNFNQPCLLIPKEEQQDVALQNYSPNALTPPPVLLLVIKVDGSNNPIKDDDDKKPLDKKLSESPVKDVKSNLNIVKPISPKDRNCTVTKSDSAQSENLDQGMEVKDDPKNIQIKTNGLIRVANPNSKTCSIENVTIQSPQKSKPAIEVQSKPVEADVTIQNSTVIEKGNENPVVIDTVPFMGSETVIPATPQESSPTKIRLPVKGGGNVKEIFISPRELKKLAKIKPGDFKPTTSPVKVNDTIVKNTAEVYATPRLPPSKFKFISQVVKPATISDAKPIFQKPRGKATAAVEPATDVTAMLPPPACITTASKFLGTNNSGVGSRIAKNEEFENESVFSEAIGDDDCLKDNLLATVIDFQEQNNQEFAEIKNLMKQNNLLQRETNRLLRLLLEKM